MSEPTPVLPRTADRAADALRPITFERDVAPAALGSVRIGCGQTQVICAVSIEEGVPPWMRAQKVPGGWLTAEYSLLSYATRPRTRREVTAGKVSGRTAEIQRLIGRALRAVVDLKALGPRTVWVDCDVLQADGGTRTAAITGAFVALRLAVERALAQGLLTENPIQQAVAAVSCGCVAGRALLDLDYSEDVAADVDLNVVMTASGAFIELQGSAEGAPFSPAQLAEMLGLADQGIRHLLALQQAALG